MSEIEKPEEIIDEIVNSFDNLQKHFSESAVIAGQEKERMRGMRKYWVEIGNTDTHDENIAKVVVSGSNALLAFRDEVKNYESIAIPITEKMELLDLGVNSTAGNTSTSASLVLFRSIEQKEFTKPVFDNYNKIYSRISNIDTDLAKTYSEIREVLYGTRADPERGALFLIRQAYDHLFGILAPDEEVRKSIYFKRKEEKGKEDQIHRHERIQYAANVTITNKQIAKTLLAESRHMLDVYDVLNEAHNRGQVDEQKARIALIEMNALLERWIIAYTE